MTLRIHTVKWYQLVLGGSNLSKHLKPVRVHYCNTSKGCTLLKRLKEQWLGWLELNLSGLELGKVRWVLNLLHTSLLGHLPVNLGHFTCKLGGTGEDKRTVTWLEDSWVLLYNNHGAEFLNRQTFSFLLKVDDVSWGNNLVLANTLDGHTYRVTWSGGVQNLLVLFDGEHLLTLKSGWSNSNDITRTKSSLLYGTADDLTNSLNVVYSGNWKTKWGIWVTSRWGNEVVQSIEDSLSCNLNLWLEVSLPSLVPSGLVSWLYKVVSVETRVWDEWNLLWLEANNLKHLYEFILNFLETSLVPSTGVHLVDSNNDLLYSEEVEKTGMLTGLTLFNSELGVGLGDSSLETTLLCRNKKKTYISGRIR